MSRGTAITGEPKGNRPGSLEILEKRVAAIEKTLADFTARTTKHTTIHTGTPGFLSGLPGLLVGHAEIARFIRKSPATVRRYARRMAFPAMRFGRHVVSHPQMIFDWLWAVEKMRLRRRGIIK